MRTGNMAASQSKRSEAKVRELRIRAAERNSDCLQMDDDVQRLIGEIQQRSVNWARVKNASDRKMRRMLAATPNLMSVSQLRWSLSGFPEGATETPSRPSSRKDPDEGIPRRSPLSGCTSSSWSSVGRCSASAPKDENDGPGMQVWNYKTRKYASD